MTKEEAKKFGLLLLHGIMERNESYPVYANNVKQAIDALSESGSSEIPKDLEEAAHSYSESDEPLYSPGRRFHWDDDSLFGKQIETTFIAGAKWQKEQDDKELSEKIAAAYQLGLADKEKMMIKEAVEGVVMDFSSHLPRPQVDVYVDPNKYCTGDKVRIIIVKED